MSAPERVFPELNRYHEAAAQLRGKYLRELFAPVGSAIIPSRRALRTLTLAFLVATAAFWAVMLNDPPTTVASGPEDSAGIVAPFSLTIPRDLPSAQYDAH